MTKPHISVLIDTYNHERYIEQAIVSVLEQDFPREEMEIVVVDDGSTDSTPSIIQKFLPSRSVHQEEEWRPGLGLQRGIAGAAWPRSWHFSTETIGGRKRNLPPSRKPSRRIRKLRL